MIELSRCPGCFAQENGEIFEALKTMSAYFLRADAHSICQCIQAFGLNDILFSIVRLERLFARTRDTSPVRGELTNTGKHEGRLKDLWKEHGIEFTKKYINACALMAIGGHVIAEAHSLFPGRALRNALAECQDCGPSVDESLSAPAASKEVCAVKEVCSRLVRGTA